MAKREPRGPKGEREYFDTAKNRWVRKSLVQGGSGATRKYRVLTRKPTDPGMPAALAVPQPLEDGAGSEGASGVSEESGSEGDATNALGL